MLNEQRNKLNLISDLVKQNKEIDSLIYMSQFSDEEINILLTNKENKSNNVPNRSKYIQTKILVHFILTTVLLFRMEKEFF